MINYKKTITIGILVLSTLCGRLVSANNIDSSIPSIPNNFQGVDLKSSFNPAVGNGIIYSDDNSVLQVSNGKQQLGALWSKTTIDLSKKFILNTYIYLGDSGADAGDGLTFSLQQYGTSYVGSYGSGLGIYGHTGLSPNDTSDNDRYKFSLEFDTYFNDGYGEYSDSFSRSGGSNGLSRRTNHIAWTSSQERWQNYQYHFGASQAEQGEYFSNGSWKNLVVTGIPKGNNQAELTYTYRDLKSNKVYSNSATVDYGKGNDPYNIGSDPPHIFNGPIVYWGFTSATGGKYQTSAITFGTLPQTPAIATKDITIYQGGKWDASKNFVSGNDETATDFEFGDSRLSTTNNVDTTKPGTYNVTYTYNNGGYTGTASAKVTVLEDQTNIKTKDSVLYVGQKWNKESNFVSATDEDGNAIPWSDSRISSNGATVDTSKPGTYSLIYTIKGKLKNVDSKFTVTVKEDKSSIQTKNTTLQVGQAWNKESNFVGATDEDGNPVSWSDSRISSNDASVDTSKAGVTKLKYTYKGEIKNTDSEFTVTVEDPLKLIVPSSSDFGTYKLGSSNTVLPWNKNSKIEVEGSTNSQWDLSVALNSNSSLKDYIKIGETPITESSQKVVSGKGTMAVTDELSSDKFIKVDYTGVKQLRKDTGTLEWSLTPSTEGIRE